MTAKGKRVGRPRNPPPTRMPEPYERPEYAARLQAILDALEIGELTKEARLYLQRIIRRRDLARSVDPKLFTGEQLVTVLLRTIFESSNGGAALTVPILEAASSCLYAVWVDKGLAWIEAFDRIDLVGLHRTLTDLGLADQLSLTLRFKLEDILGPPTIAPIAKPVKTKAPKKPPAHVTRVPVIEKRIEIGMQLIQLRSTVKSNQAFGALRKKQFPDLDNQEASGLMKVAKAFGNKPEVYKRTTWQMLACLASPKLTAAARLRFETAIIAGKKVRAEDVERSRGRLPSGRPKRAAELPARMAA